LKKYECVFIFDESKLETSAEASIATISEYIVSLGGTIVESEDMGRKTFSYPIKKKNSGLYWDLVFELDASKVAELKSNYRLDESILRMEVFNFERPEKPVTLSSRR